jgi:intracellular septation protein
MRPHKPTPGPRPMQLLIDFFPIIVFFVVYQIAGMYWATGAIIVAMAIQMGIQWLRERKVSKMLLVSTALVAVLGGVTILLQDPLFIQWKPTVVNWLFAAAFLVSEYIGGKNLTERVMGHAVKLEAPMWRQLNLIWVANFAVLGAANLFVVYNFDEATWVNFKLFGMLGLTLITAVGQAIWIASKTSEHPQGEERT